MTPRFRFPKRMKLCSPTAIQRLYEQGKTYMASPFRVIYLLEPQPAGGGDNPLQIVMSVPKKRFKHAVDRNLLKRRMREAFRLHAPALLPLLQGRKLHILCIYTAYDIQAYALLESKMRKVLDHFCQLVEESAQPAPHPADQVL